MDRVLDTLLRTNDLKVTPRSGWVMRGIAGAESVAEHTYGVAFVALVLAGVMSESETGVTIDRGKLLTFALLHDLPESLTGDLSLPAQRFFPPGAKRAAEAAAQVELLGSLPGGAQLLESWEEYLRQDSIEAQLVHDADRLDTWIQAYQYERRTGNRSLAEFWPSQSDVRQGHFALAFEASHQLLDSLIELRKHELEGKQNDE